MIIFTMAVRALTALALRALQLLRAEVFGAIHNDQRTASETLKRRQAPGLLEHRDDLVKGRLQQRGWHHVEH